MKKTYPIVLTPDNNGFIVYMPDFDINTQGHDLTEAIEMAADYFASGAPELSLA